MLYTLRAARLVLLHAVDKAFEFERAHAAPLSHAAPAQYRDDTEAAADPWRHRENQGSWDAIKAGFFGLSTLRMEVDPGASLRDLMNDASCLMETAIDAIESMTDEAVGLDVPSEVSQSWFPMLYTLQAARVAFVHAYEKAFEVEPAHAGPLSSAAPAQRSDVTQAPVRASL